MSTDTGKAISLVDNATPAPLEQDLTRAETSLARFLLTKPLTKGSVRNELQRRKYSKWQPERLGASDTEASSRNVSRTTTRNTVDRDTDVNLFNIAPGQLQATESVKAEENAASNSELEILYENQRGWFFFGVPFYSHRSLLQFDPPAWVNKDYHDSPVNITNAQLPDPSWEWAWQSWYVDMSDDVDEEGWQYSFSFVPKCGWHGTHPWFHSYVRRRRWVRLRVKKKSARLRDGTEQTDFHRAHMLNEDYFTIHPPNVSGAEPSIAPANVPSSAYLRRDTDASPERPVEENVENIPTLFQALKNAIVDREKIDTLRKFIAQGGEEIYYLPERVPEILALFVFQTSRWQFLKILQDALNDTNGTPSNADKKEDDARQRKRNNILRAIEAVNREVSNYEVFDISKDDDNGLQDSRMHQALNARESSRGKGKGMLFSEIKGIPKGAAIGKEGHIY
ncbi:hypothetical protein UA08_05573 [Talaromyces atroroseus]|uniref:Peroxin/Ferlin domain-containing protein n=1 Tax=Talaromyces atroroseus TaxID=1441469 RepID=A0A225AKP2_TALAT|nr:hypothetical protein UA08_05573 [Talaromyces atroroseus]OKL58874.1 hypothetical protein UA08_05573 [Talaromyces atroroseus]